MLNITSSSGKYKSKPQWDTTSHLSEWLTLTTQATTDVGEMLSKRLSFALLVGMETGGATLKNSIEVPQQIKNRTILWPSNCTTRYLSKGYRYAVSKGHMHPNVYSSTINNSQSMERAQMSINRWVDKEDVVYICNGVLLSNQKEWNLPFAAMWMELEGIMLSEISRRKKNIIWLHSYEDFKIQNRRT